MKRLILALLFAASLCQAQQVNISAIPTVTTAAGTDKIIVNTDIGGGVIKTRTITIANASLIFTPTWTNIAGKPTTISGYGITDAFNPAIPGPIGGTTPNTGAFTAVTINGSSTSVSQFIANLAVSSTVTFGSSTSGPTSLNAGNGTVGTVASNFSLGPTTPLQWLSLSNLSTGVADTILTRDGAAGNLAQRNGTNAQTLRIYNTYTDASNYSRLVIGPASGGVTPITVEEAGTGVGTGPRIRFKAATSLAFNLNNADRWTMDVNGHLLANTDNSVDIGAAGATRPRNVYVAGDIYAAADSGAAIRITNSNVDIAQIGANTANELSVSSLCMAGTTIKFSAGLSNASTSAFPSLKRVNTAIAIRRGDDTIGTFADLPAAATGNEGSMAPISDSTTNVWGATITGGGANHVMAYSNGTAWTVMAK